MVTSFKLYLFSLNEFKNDHSKLILSQMCRLSLVFWKMIKNDDGWRTPRTVADVGIVKKKKIRSLRMNPATKRHFETEK